MYVQYTRARIHRSKCAVNGVSFVVYVEAATSANAKNHNDGLFVRARIQADRQPRRIQKG